MNENITKFDYENIIYYILYLRDRNPKKDWGHIWWWTTVFSYCSTYYNKDNFWKYEIFLNSVDLSEDSFLQMIKDWHNWNYERKYLDKYNFEWNYLYNFIYAISYIKYNDHNYYFRFSEMIDMIWYKYLLKSHSQKSDYLFTNIALASYYFHNKNYDLSYKFYLHSLKLDSNNPYILYKFAMLCTYILWFENLINAEKIIKKVVDIIPYSPFVYEWYWYILNLLWKYSEALFFLEKYEKLTEWKHRTFEPFMRKSESYIWLGDFRKARIELNRINDYYFWEWYRFLYNEIDNKLKKLWY